MATATPQLFNSADFAVIAELLYRRTGLLIQKDQVTYAIIALPGTESATDGFVGYGDDATLSFIPKIGNVALASGLTVTALRQTLNGVTTTLNPSTYSINPVNQAVVFTVPPAMTARLHGDFTGKPVPYLTLTAVTTLPDLSRGPFVGSVRLQLSRQDISTQIPAILVYSDAFPPTMDALITYLQTHFGLAVTDGEFFMVSDVAHTPIVRGGGLINGTLDGNRQFKLEVTNSSIRWAPGSQIVLQQQSMQSIVPPGRFAFVGAPVDGSLGEPYNYTFQTVNGTAPITYSVISGTPPCPVNPTTGAMHADALNALAAYSWVIKAQDAVGQITTLNCIMHVRVTPLIMTPDSMTPSWTVGIPQSLNFNPYGGQHPVTYAVTSGSLPVGLAIVGDGLQGTMEGNPSPSNPTLQSIFTITATDNQNQKAVMNFNATINDRSTGAITASLCSKVLNWWDMAQSTAGTNLPVGSILYDGTNRMNLTVGGGTLYGDSTGRANTSIGLNFGGTSYAKALTTAYNLSRSFTLLSLMSFPSSTAVLPGQIIFGRDGDNVNGGFSLQVGNGGNTLALVTDVNGTSNTTNFTTTLPVGVGNWSMVMVERYNDTPSLVLNAGSVETAVSVPGPLSANNVHPFTLGVDPGLTPSAFFGGESAMTAIFSDKLWSDERKWLWNNGTGRKFSDMNYWPATILHADATIPATWAVDDPVAFTFTVSGGTGIYFNFYATGLPPGVTASFDGINKVTLTGAPTTLGTYPSPQLYISSTDGNYTNAGLPTITVSTAIVPLVNLPMTGVNGATTVTDSTGRIWTVNGSAAVSTTADTNGAMLFPSNGTGWLSTPMTHDMDLVNMSFTAQIDVYPTVGANGGIINSKLGAAASVPLFLNSIWSGVTLQPAMGWIDASGNSISELAPAGVGLAQNAWNNIKCTYNAALYKLTFFLNEQVIATGIFNGKVHSAVNTSDSLILGGSSYTSQVNNPFQGYLRNFKWWSGLVYDTLALKNTVFGPFTPNQAGTFNIGIVGGDGNYTVAATSLPAGLSASLVGSNSVTVSGTTAVAGGTYSASVTLTSGDGQNVVVPITVDVASASVVFLKDTFTGVANTRLVDHVGEIGGWTDLDMTQPGLGNVQYDPKSAYLNGSGLLYGKTGTYNGFSQVNQATCISNVVAPQMDFYAQMTINIGSLPSSGSSNDLTTYVHQQSGNSFDQARGFMFYFLDTETDIYMPDWMYNAGPVNNGIVLAAKASNTTMVIRCEYRFSTGVFSVYFDGSLVWTLAAPDYVPNGPPSVPGFFSFNLDSYAAVSAPGLVMDYLELGTL